MKANFYVVMTDKALSGWGKSEGKINKLVFLCDTLEEAETVEQNANNRGDMKNIRITERVPYYSSSKYLVQFKSKEDYPNWYKVRAF